MSETKTKATDTSVIEFLNAVEHPTRRADGLRLHQIFTEVTGWTPKMWGPTIVGYGAYSYKYESGHEGTSLATGFSPRKFSLSLYIMPGYLDMTDELSRLGKHKIGKACLYINKLADVNEDVVAEIIQKGLADLGRRWDVTPT